MKAKGQGLLALLSLAVLVAAGVGADRLGPRARSDAAAGGAAPSGAWFCPHGGADAGWQTTLSIANPGVDPVDIRLTSLGSKRTGVSETFTVAAGATLSLPADATSREASSFVEYFGGWVAVGWVTTAGGQETGVAAEPCLDTADTRTWFAADGNTDQGQDDYLIVMNPFDVEAVFDVVLLTASRAPIRNSDLTGSVLPAHRSVALHLNKWADGEVAVGAEVDVSFGRVAVATLGTSDAGGIRSVVASASASGRTMLPATGDSGQSTLVVMSPAEGQARFGATLSSSEPLAPAGGLTGAVQGGTSSKTYAVASLGPSSIDVHSDAGSPGLVAVRRVLGKGTDQGATVGATSAASAWIVMPSAAGDPAAPGLVISNPSDAPVQVTLTILPTDGQAPSSPTLLMIVPAGATVEAEEGFLSQDLSAAILATAGEGTFVAAGASSSFGTLGEASYAIAGAIPVPA